MARAYLATGDRFGRLEDLEASEQPRWSLEGSKAQCIAVDPADGDVVYVGCAGGGLRRTRDGGATWDRLALPEDDVFAVAVSRADGAVYAGTEPSRLFRSRDGGDTFVELEALQAIPSKPSWSFPPRPWTSHVHAIAPDPHDADRVLVGIELGGVMYSDDGGATFGDHRRGAQRDVHALAWHPTAAGRAYEAAGGGAAWSDDGGATWSGADEGRGLRYVWGLAVDPDDPDRWFVSAAAGPLQAHGSGDAGAHIFGWEGASGPWRRLTPEPLSAMPYGLTTAPGLLAAGLSDGRILVSRDAGGEWSPAAARVDRIVALATAA